MFLVLNEANNIICAGETIHQRILHKEECINPSLHCTYYSAILERTWGIQGAGGAPGDVTLPYQLVPDCDRASQQGTANRLGRSESSGVCFYRFRSPVDIPGQIKLKKHRFPGRYFFVNSESVS